MPTSTINSPNDAVVAADGSIWFCDPAYAIGGYYEGIKAEPEQEKKNVFRVDPKTGDIKSGGCTQQGTPGTTTLARAFAGSVAEQ